MTQNDAWIDPENEEDRKLLDDIQGNILRPHGRAYAKHVLLRFKTDDSGRCGEEIANNARKWIRNIGVTSALKEYERYKEAKNDHITLRDYSGILGFFKMFALSKSGYEALGIPKDKQPQDLSFQDGMLLYELLRVRGAVSYEEDYRGSLRNEIAEDREGILKELNLDSRFERDIHAIVIIAHNNFQRLENNWLPLLINNENRGEIFDEIVDFQQERDVIDGHLLHVRPNEGHEKCQDLKIYKGPISPNDKKIHYYVEHFGYRDGISQPLILKNQIDQEKKQFDRERKFDELNGYEPDSLGKWSSAASRHVVLSKDAGVDDADSYGSYLVFRQLEQHVPEFRNAVRELSKEFNEQYPDSDVDECRAGAMVFGRFKDGTPVLDRRDRGSAELEPTNNFDYRTDPKGKTCPFHAHIRRLNPRGELTTMKSFVDPSIDPRNTEELERNNRIVRCGMPYGDPLNDEENGNQNQKRGLLFQSCQSNLKVYETLQIRADRHFFVPFGYTGERKEEIGIDGIVGIYRDKWNLVTMNKQKWVRDSQSIRHSIWDFVRFKGGEYFYAPSITSLKNI